MAKEGGAAAMDRNEMIMNYNDIRLMLGVSERGEIYMDCRMVQEQVA